MPTLQIKAHLSTDELLEAAAQLNKRELDRFASEVLALRARRRAPALSRSEAELLLKINQAISPEKHKRFRELVNKRRAESLTAEEQQELLLLGDEMERLEAERLKLLTELATLRGMSLREVMDDLGIRP